MAWGDDAVMSYHLGHAASAERMTSADDGGIGVESVRENLTSGIEGRIGLSLLSLAILGVMFFYVATKGKQL